MIREDLGKSTIGHQQPSSLTRSKRPIATLDELREVLMQQAQPTSTGAAASRAGTASFTMWLKTTNLPQAACTMTIAMVS
ncbi:MAG: hypothetical protein ACXVDF_01980 [Ktedonobacterales bacterium]